MKKLNDKQKKIINIVVTALQICIVILAITLSAIILANPRVDSAEVGKGGTKLLPVLTNSMEGTEKDSFKEGDLVVAKKPKDASSLEEGDIITYKITVAGQNKLNTHRIVSKKTDGEGNVYFNTKGDNNAMNDQGFVYAKDVLAVYSFHLKGVGSAIAWLQQPTNFLLVIVLPLIILFIYNIILFVKMMMQAKMSKLQEGQGTLAVSSIDEEELKRKAIEEYLASQEATKQAADAAPQVEETADDAPAEDTEEQ